MSTPIRITTNYVKYAMDTGANGEWEDYIEYFDTPKAMFRHVSKMIAFDDNYALDIREIVADGRQCEYYGWRPNMEYIYYDRMTGDLVFDEYFPEWDH